MKATGFSGLLVIFAAAAAGCGQAKAYQKPLTPVRVETARSFVPSEVASSGIRYSATIRAASQMDLSFKAGGYLHELLQVRSADGQLRNIQEGDCVKRGTILARLREDDFTNRVKGAEAQVAEAQSTLQTASAQKTEAEAAAEQTRRDLARATALLESDSLTRPEFESARTKFEMAQAKLQAARAYLDVIHAKINGTKSVLSEAQLATRDSVLRAPFDCIVLRRGLEEGSLVTPGMPIFTLAESSSVKAVFGVPDLTVQSLPQGKELTLTTEALPGAQFHGVITRISAMADAKTRVFEVEVTIHRAPTHLRAGMIASLTLPDPNASSTPVTVVPLSAIVRSAENRDEYSVTVLLNENGHQVVRHRRVRLGEAYGNLIAVTEGIESGDRVVIAGGAAITNGEPVRVTE